MTQAIPLPKISEILEEEFMQPVGISDCQLAAALHVPLSIIQDLLNDKLKITASLSSNLGKCFGVSDNYFLKLQADINRHK